MRKLLALLALLIAGPLYAQDADSLIDAARTETVRMRGFNRAAETQGTKVLALLDSLLALPAPGGVDTVFVTDTVPSPPDTVIVTDTVTVVDTLLVTDTVTVVDTVEVELPPDTVTVADTVTVERYPVRPPLPAMPSVRTELLDTGWTVIWWDESCPVYSITGPDDPWAVELEGGDVMGPGPCPSILQDAWRVRGGPNSGDGPTFDHIVQSLVTNYSVDAPPGNHWACVSRLFGPRPEAIGTRKMELSEYWAESEPRCVSYTVEE